MFMVCCVSILMRYKSNSMVNEDITFNPQEHGPISPPRKIMGHIKQTKWTTYNMFLQLFLKYNPSLWKICNVTNMLHLGVYF